MFPKVAPDFFKNRSKGPVVFKPEPEVAAAPAPAPKAAPGQAAKYSVNVDGVNYNVVVAPAGTVAVTPAASPAAPAAPAAAVPATPAAAPAVSVGSAVILAPVAGSVVRYAVSEGADVKSGDNVLILESMKMELEIKAAVAGKVHFLVSTGSQVASQQPIAEIGGAVVATTVAPPVAPPPVAPVAPPPPEPAAPVSAAPTGAGAVINAPVAGTIIRYSVSEGSAVKPGDNVLIMESMKMELEIKSATTGKVHFLIATGSQVASQQPIAEIG